MKKILLILSMAAIVFASCKHENLDQGIYAKIKTDKGDLLLKLYYEEAPMTTANFVALAEGTMGDPIDSTYAGKKYYDGLKFHRVVPGFVIQGGDPTGTGAGGPGYEFPNEIVDSLSHVAGVLSMANAGPDTNGSQFFITMEPAVFLDGGYSIFGRLVNPADTSLVKKIAEGDLMNKIEIIRVGDKAKKWNAYEEFKAAYQKAMADMKAKAEAARAQFEAEKAKYMKTHQAKLAKAKEYPGGLKIYIEKNGKGDNPIKGQTVSVNYTGMLENGKVFDSSYERNQPIEFMIGRGQVIQGWDEGLMQLKKGSKATLYIPSEMAYGDREVGGVIPPNSNLIFEVELVDIK